MNSDTQIIGNRPVDGYDGIGRRRWRIRSVSPPSTFTMSAYTGRWTGCCRTRKRSSACDQLNGVTGRDPKPLNYRKTNPQTVEVGLVGLLMQSRCALRRRFVAADRKPIFWTTVLERANGKKTTLKTRSQFARFPRGTAPHYIHAMLVD